MAGTRKIVLGVFTPEALSRKALDRSEMPDRSRLAF
jgi:hypothetical protein